MPRLFLGNFHFEHELAANSGWQPSAMLCRMNAERAVCWIALAEDGDGIWTPEPIRDDFWESLAIQGLPRVQGISDLASLSANEWEVVPWGWSKWSRGIAARSTPPSDPTVRLGNSRQWSYELERQLAVALPGSARLERMDDFADAVRRSASEFGESLTDHAWIIKANFGMAARERLLGHGPALKEPQQRWLQRRLDADGVIFFEPWLPRRAEVGIQWTLPTLGHGQPKLEGITPLWCDSQGEYRGSEFSLDQNIPSEWQRAVEVCEQAAIRLQELGYFGPLGIDAAIYQDSAGRTHTRPLQDINARYTMGRLALGFRRLLRTNERGMWWHGRSEGSSPLPLSEAVREIDLTPPLVGDRLPTHASRLAMSRFSETVWSTKTA